jgi:O-antigen ligase
MDEAPATRAPAGGGWTAVAGWGAATLVLAVAGAVDPWGFRPFTTPRWAVVAVAAAATAATVLAGTARPHAAGRPPGAGRLRSGVVLAGTGLLVCLAVATATALDPLTALLGHPRRHLGLLGWVVFALAFVVGARLPPARVRRAVGRAAVVAAGVTGIAAVADVAGWDPAGSRFAGGRAGGLLGQPVYLGAVAVLLAPVALGVAAERRERPGWRRAAGLAAAGALVALLASQTRGAWLGVALALVVAGPRVASRARAWLADRSWIVVAALALVAVAALVPVAARTATALDPDAPGGRGRVDDWVVAARVVAAHPVTGVGPEGYRIAAPAHLDDGYARRHGRDEVVDRAHNGPLDVAATAGLPAGALYVAVLGGVVASAVRVVRRCPDPVVVGAALGVIAWVGHLAVSFPIAEVDPLAWLLAGVVVAAATRLSPGQATDRSRPAPAAPRRGPRVGTWAPPGRIAATAGAVGLAVTVLAVGWTGVAADRDLRAAERASAARDPAAAVAAADRATARRPDDIDAWYLAARVASAPAGLPAVDAGLDRVEEGLTRSSRDPALRALHTDLLVERALRSGLADDLATAEAAARDRIAADPSGPRAHRQLGQLLVATDRPHGARVALARALALDPDDAAATQALAAIDHVPPGAAQGSDR